jgi:UPF0271 protein
VFKIDLNADIGEGMPYDHQLIKYISSCNIACGGHAGDDESISETIKLALRNDVKIGAHPSYPDKENFGRKSLEMSLNKLVDSIDFQLKKFEDVCKLSKANWHHIKFHGALYNDLKTDHQKAEALVNLISKKYQKLILYVPPNSVIKAIAGNNNIPIKIEGFADRAYNADLSLVPRQEPNAVLNDTCQALRQVNKMILHQKVETRGGNKVAINIQTLCLHGDTPGALDLVKAIVRNLKTKNINIE